MDLIRRKTPPAQYCANAASKNLSLRDRRAIERFRSLGSAALGSIVSMTVVRIMVRVHLVTIKTLESF